MNTNDFDADSILAAVEEHINGLPVTRRRRPADDNEPEGENYCAPAQPVDVPSLHLELTHAQQVDLHLLLMILADTKGAGQSAILRQVRAMLGLSADSLAEARRSYGKGGAQ